MAMFDEQLHSTRAGDNLLHLPEIDEKCTVAAYNHRIGLYFVFHLLGGSAEHVGTYPVIAKMKDFPVADMIPAMILVWPLSWAWTNWIIPML